MDEYTLQLTPPSTKMIFTVNREISIQKQENNQTTQLADLFNFFGITVIH